MGCLITAHIGPEHLQTILFTQSVKLWRAPNRSFSEHRNESTFVYLFEKTAPHPRLSNLWNTPGKIFKIKIKVAEVLNYNYNTGW